MRHKSILWGTVVLALLRSMGLEAQQSDSSTSDNANLPVSLQSAGGTFPRLIKFSGGVKDLTGKVPTGVVGLTFALYELPEGGSPLWAETQSLPLDSLGRYTALLGASSPGGLPLDLFTSGKALWLGVQPQLQGQGEQPRVLLVAVPYALKASDSDTLGGKSASAYALAGSQTLVGVASGNAPSSASTTTVQPGSQAAPAADITSSPRNSCTPVTSDGTATANTLAKFTSACNVEKSLIRDNGTGVAVGGTSTPGALLDVQYTSTATSGSLLGHRVWSTFNPATTSSASNVGTFFDTATASGNTQNFTSRLSAMNAELDHYGTGTLASGYGMGSWIRNQAAGTITSALGVYASLANTSTGTISNGFGVFVDSPANSGGGKFSHYIGLYIANPTAVTGAYGLFSDGGKNYFGGNVGIGTTSPAANLEVNGTAKFDGLVTFKSGQAFPGTGTITGVTTASTSGLTGGGTSGNLSLAVNEGVVAFQSDLSTGISTAETFATNAANTAKTNAISTAETFAGNAASTAQANAISTAGTFAGNAASTAQANAISTAESFAGSAASTAQTNAVSTAETFAKNTFLPLAGGTLTGALMGTTAAFGGELTAAGTAVTARGTATTAKGFTSNPMDLLASSFNSGTSAAVPQLFRWEAEPAGNNTASPSGTLNLLYLSGTGTPGETGLSIAGSGQITFASGQTFPGTGTGTVTSVATGAGLTGGTITTSGTISIPSAGVTDGMLASACSGIGSCTGSYVTALSRNSAPTCTTLPIATTSTAGIVELAGDVGGSAGSVKVTGLQGVPVSSSAPATSQVLTYNGSNWAPANASSGGGASIYGDGSDGNVSIGAADWTSSAPSYTLQFQNFTVTGALTVPSGLIIRATGNVLISGSITVAPSPANTGTSSVQGISEQGASSGSPGSAGLAYSTFQLRQLLKPGFNGGGAGSAGGSGTTSGGGGGTLVILAAGSMTVQGGGSITANGTAGSLNSSSGIGGGGGAGGVVILASKTSISNGGTITTNGGAGAPGQSGSCTASTSPGTSASGGGGGGVLHFLAPSGQVTPGAATANGGSAGSSDTECGFGGYGGASGGNGGSSGTSVTFATAGSAGVNVTTAVADPATLFLP